MTLSLGPLPPPPLKDENLKELWRDFVIENGSFPESVRHKLLYFPHRYKNFWVPMQLLLLLLLAVAKVEVPALA